MYQTGMRKGWAYNIPTKFKDTFFNKYPGGKELEWRYRLKKQLSLRSMGDGSHDAPEDTKRLEQRDKIITGIYNDFIKSERKLSAWLEEKGVPLSREMVGVVVGKYKENAVVVGNG